MSCFLISVYFGAALLHHIQDWQCYYILMSFWCFCVDEDISKTYAVFIKKNNDVVEKNVFP